MTALRDKKSQIYKAYNY